MTRSRKERLETLKRDMLNMWIIFKRMPLLVFYFACIIGAMAITVYIIGIIFLGLQN
mgnify:CR=1 FL=1